MRNYIVVISLLSLPVGVYSASALRDGIGSFLTHVVGGAGAGAAAFNILHEQIPLEDALTTKEYCEELAKVRKVSPVMSQKVETQVVIDRMTSILGMPVLIEEQTGGVGLALAKGFDRVIGSRTVEFISNQKVNELRTAIRAIYRTYYVLFFNLDGSLFYGDRRLFTNADEQMHEYRPLMAAFVREKIAQEIKERISLMMPEDTEHLNDLFPAGLNLNDITEYAMPLEWDIMLQKKLLQYRIYLTSKLLEQQEPQLKLLNIAETSSRFVALNSLIDLSKEVIGLPINPRLPTALYNHQRDLIILSNDFLNTVRLEAEAYTKCHKMLEKYSSVFEKLARINYPLHIPALNQGPIDGYVSLENALVRYKDELIAHLEAELQRKRPGVIRPIDSVVFSMFNDKFTKMVDLYCEMIQKEQTNVPLFLAPIPPYNPHFADLVERPKIPAHDSLALSQQPLRDDRHHLDQPQTNGAHSLRAMVTTPPNNKPTTPDIKSRLSAYISATFIAH